MVSAPGRDLDYLSLLYEFPGGRDQIHGPAKGLLDLEELLELLNTLHGVVRVSGRSRNQVEGLCGGK